MNFSLAFTILTARMARILAIDYGLKRCGIAVTDPLQIIATALDNVERENLCGFLVDYCKKNEVEKVIFGTARHADGSYTHLKKHIDESILELKAKLPNIVFDFQDEAFTSFEAKDIILNSGYKKKKRRDKAMVDKISAVLILQRYLKHI